VLKFKNKFGTLRVKMDEERGTHGEKSYPHRILMGKFVGKRPLGTAGHRWENNRLLTLILKKNRMQGLN
jgi:hypothetical protein